MDIGLDDDARQFRDSVRAVLAAECPAELVRSTYDEPAAWQPLWRTIAGLGWTGVVDAEGDDSDIGLVLALLEPAGEALVPAPLLSTVAAAAALRSCRADAASLLGEIAQGTTAALLLAGGERLPGPGLALSGGRVHGELQEVRDGGRAEVLVALAADEAGHPHVVAFRRDRVDTEPHESVDPSQPIASVRVDVEPDLCVQVVAEHALIGPLIACAAELLGIADRAVSMSVAHAATREQFGQPIGAFQAVKHRLADAYVGLERARSLTYLAASRCSGGATSRPADAATADGWRAALLAKASANDAAVAATRAAVATHGAIAQTWEHDAHLLVRRAWQSAALVGRSAPLYAVAGRDYLQVAS